MSANTENKSLLGNPAVAEELFQLEKRARENMGSASEDGSRIAAQAFVRVLPHEEHIVRGGLGIIRDINGGRQETERQMAVGDELNSITAVKEFDPKDCLFKRHPDTDPEKAFSSDPVSAARETSKLDFEQPQGKACISEMIKMIETAKQMGQLIGPQRPVITPARTAALAAKANLLS